MEHDLDTKPPEWLQAAEDRLRRALAELGA
jgi:hypothetical protein